MLKRRPSVEVVWMAAAAVGALIIAAWALDLPSTSLYRPWTYSWDGFFYEGTIKAIIDHGWFLHNPDLGAPFGSDNYDFPVVAGDTAQVLIVKAFGVFASSPFTVTNAFLLLTYVLNAAAGFWGMRALGAGRAPALICSILFATLPYHYLKGEQQLFFSSYYGIPIAAVLAVRAGAGEPLFGPRRRTVWTLVQCAIVAAAGIYYAVFAVLLVAVAGGLRLLTERRRGAVLPALGVLAAIGAVIVLTQAPTLVYHLRHGGNNEVAQRQPWESEYYGLKLDQLVLPIRGHRIGALERLSEPLYTDSHVPGEPSGALGIVGVVGLVWLFLVALGNVFAPGRLGSPRERHLSALTVSAFLIATVGGISAVIALTLTPQIRSWGRMSIMIGFFALTAVALLLTRVRMRRTPAAIGLVALLVLGALDQTSAQQAPDYKAMASQYASDAGFVHGIERELPRGAMILTLPYEAYPEAPPWAEGDYQNLRPYLSSSSLRFSYGAMEGRPADWSGALQEVPLRTLVDGALAAGFSGVWADTKAFPDGGAALEGELGRLLGPPQASADKRLVFWDGRARARIVRARPGAAAERRDTLRPVVHTYGTGFFGLEGGGADRWHWAGARAELTLHNPDDAPRTVRLSALLRTDADQPGTTTVRLPDGRTLREPIDQAGTRVHLTFPVGPGRSVVRFDTEGTPVLPADGRQLWMQARNLVVVDAALCPTAAWSCTDGPRPQLP